MSATNQRPFCKHCGMFHFLDMGCLTSATVSNHTTLTEPAKQMLEASKERSDGLSASYYELPEGSTELYHLITYKDMNAQLGEIFRACYRYGQVEHSAKLRDINKIIAYATQEKERLLKYELSSTEG